MPRPVKIELVPLGTELLLPEGSALADPLFEQGVEFPCGGRGRCKGCKIRVISGDLPISPEDAQRLTVAELGQGWRLACRAHATSDLRIELAQWEAAILSDDSAFAFQPQSGLGIAVDLGTTTLVAQLVDLATADVLAVRTALNVQAQHGADIMSRVEMAVADQGQKQLEQLIRRQIGDLARELFSSAHHARPADLQRMVIVGNTVMHHLFCGLDLEPLSHFPFEPADGGVQSFTAAELGWADVLAALAVHFLPCLGGFVGSDLLAGILATRLHERDHLCVLLDLGTNGEIVLGNRDRLLCASTAAGPAFEGARISMGMRAATGAISEVHVEDGRFVCHVLGNEKPRGICGSGLVDAIAAGLKLGRIRPSGRLANGPALELAPPVALNQWDVRELQLAKGAIAAGVRILLDRWGASRDDVAEVFLAGAFGNYINYTSARRIGLLQFPPEKVRPVGNTALLGAKLALFELAGQDGQFSLIRDRARHVSLSEDPRFQEIYAEEMSFPELT